MVRNKRLWCRVGNTNYGYYLHTNKMTTPSICVRIGNETLYCPLTTGSSKLHVRYNNTNYGAQNYTPTLNFQIYASYNGQAYSNYWTITIRNISLSNSVSISKQIQIQTRVYGNAYSSWSTMATLNAGATSASGSSYNISWAGANCQYRVVIGGTQATSGTVAINGWRSFSYAIPTTYW